MAGAISGAPAVEAREDRAYAPRRYTPADEDAVLALLRTCFEISRDRDRLRWQVAGSPTGWSRPWVLERDGCVVAHVGVHVFASFPDGEAAEVVLVTDLAISPEHRGEGLMEVLRVPMEGANTKRMPLLAFPVEPVLGFGERRPTLTPHARLPQWIRWLRPAGLRASRPTLAGRLFAPVVPAALAARARLGGRSVRVEPLAELGAEVDELAAKSASYARCIRVRDAAYLRWRWLEQPGSGWSVLAARGRDASLRGIAVVGRDPGAVHGGAPVGRVVDLLAGDRGATTALLRAGAAELRRAGCAIATFDYLDPRPWARAACRHAGFLERGVGPSMITGQTGVAEDHPAGSRESWYLTRGDSDLA